MVEGFAETERNAHYEIGTLILSKKELIKKEHTRIIKRNTHIIKKELIKKEHSYYQKEHSDYQKEL